MPGHLVRWPQGQEGPSLKNDGRGSGAGEPELPSLRPRSRDRPAITPAYLAGCANSVLEIPIRHERCRSCRSSLLAPLVLVRLPRPGARRSFPPRTTISMWLLLLGAGACYQVPARTWNDEGEYRWRPMSPLSSGPTRFTFLPASRTGIRFENDVGGEPRRRSPRRRASEHPRGRRQDQRDCRGSSSTE